jgi:hypothetical protein
VGVIFGDHKFYGLLRRATREAGLPEEKQNLCDYDLRHSRATYWVEHSQNLAGVAFLLGHRQVTTLNRYVRPSHRAAEQVLAQAVNAELEESGASGRPEELDAAKDVLASTQAGPPSKAAAADPQTPDEDGGGGFGWLSGGQPDSPGTGSDLDSGGRVPAEARFTNKKAHLIEVGFRVRKRGVEPLRYFYHWNLNPARLPVPPLSQRGY